MTWGRKESKYIIKPTAMKQMMPKRVRKDSNNRASDLAEIARRMKPIFTKHHIHKAVLFGSFARGSQSQKSDIDLILIQETGAPYFERYKGILRADFSPDVQYRRRTPRQVFDNLEINPFTSRNLRISSTHSPVFIPSVSITISGCSGSS